MAQFPVGVGQEFYFCFQSIQIVCACVCARMFIEVGGGAVVQI
jgi:hypothetical protein